MLVIRRRPGQVLLIGEHVELEVLEVTATQVKLGIRAPRDISILRKEIQLTRAANESAVKTMPSETMKLFRRALDLSGESR